MLLFKYSKIMRPLSGPGMLWNAVIALILLPIPGYGQNYQCQWAHVAGNAALVTISSQDVTSSGNVLVTGNYLDNDLSFDNSASILHPNPDTTDNKLFLAKYDREGNLLWSKSFESGDDVSAPVITIDNQDNIYLTGYFYNYITFGALTLTQNPGTLNAPEFLAKFDSSGQLLWARQSALFAARYEVNKNGHIALYGAFLAPSVTLGNNLTLVNSDSSGLTMDFLLAELDNNGNFLWAKSGGVSGKNEEIDHVAFTRNDQIYVSGLFESAFTLDGITLNSTGNTSWDAKDWFLARYDSIGNVPWAIRGGISRLAPVQLSDGAPFIKTDQYNNLYFSGIFHNSTMQVDSLTLNGTGTLSGSIVANTVDKYWYAGMCNDKGLIWAKSGNSPVEHIHFMPAPNGTLYLAGLFRDTAVFGNITLTGTVPGGQNYEGFVVNLGTLGQVIWAKQFGPLLNIDARLEMVVDQNNTLDILGIYGDPHGIIPNITLNFDALSLSSVNSSMDYFLARYKDNGEVLSASNIGSPGTDGLVSEQLNLVGQSGLYVSGGYSASPLSLDTITVNFPVPNSNNYFIAKYDEKDSVTRINSTGSPNALMVFPNPTTGLLHLRSSEGISGIRIINVLGREIYHKTFAFPTKEYTIDLKNQPAGLYWLNIKSHKGMAAEKVIVK